MPGPLEGYRVIDLTAMISGPIATMMLGDQGADVIKVEEPGRGDFVRSSGKRRKGLPAIFVSSNRSKRSIALDLKQSRGLELLEALVAEADVFVQNFRPGRADKMGIGEEAMRKIRPDLIYVSISGFGESGPYANRRVYDPVIQALSGLAAIQADRRTGEPRLVRLIVPDKLTALTAAQAITAALLSRERSGRGQHIRLAMLDAMISFLWPEGMVGHTFVEKAEGESRPLPVRDLIYKTSDGYITAGVMSDKEWIGLTRALEHPEWLDDARFQTPVARSRHAEERLAMTAEVLETRSSSEWLQRLHAEDVPCAPVLSREDLLTDSQIAANELIVECDHPHAGRIRQPRPAARFDQTPAEIRRPAPLLGEHTDELLAEIGLSTQEIAELREQGVVS